MIEWNTRGLESQRFNIVQCSPIYVSPGMFDSLMNRSNQVEAALSNDLFAIGLCILEAGLFAPVGDRVCDYRRKKFQTDNLDLYLSEFEHFYQESEDLFEIIRELVALKGPARTDPNYLMKCRIEERLETGISPKKLEYSWVGRISEASNQTQDVPSSNWLLREKIPHTIFNSNQQLETPKDSFLEDSLIVAHHITPVTQNPGLQMQEDKLVFTPTKPAQNSPIFRFVDENTGYQPAPNTVLSSLIREPTTPTRGTTPPVQHYTPTRQERITFNPHPPSSPVMSQPSVQQTQPKPSPLRNQVPDVRAIQYQGNQTQNNHTGNLQPNEYSPVTAKRMRKRFIHRVHTQESQMMIELGQILSSSVQLESSPVRSYETSTAGGPSSISGSAVMSPFDR